jgi:hypothetical protein
LDINGISSYRGWSSIALQPDDKIVMTFGNTNGKFPTKRYKKNGTPIVPLEKMDSIYRIRSL